MSSLVDMTSYFTALTSSLNDISNKAEFHQFNDALTQTLKTFDPEGRPQALYIAGNGGSFASANHIATDLSNLFEKRYIKCPPMTSSSQSQITRIANDSGYKYIFSRDLKTYAHSIKAVLVLSVSGQSPNILELLKEARLQGIRTFSLLGFSGRGQARSLSDYSISVDSDDFRLVEDVHMIIISSLLDSICGTPNATI